MNDIGFGLTMTVLGMGSVFGVLMVVWGVLILISRIDRPETSASTAQTLDETQLAAATNQLAPEEIAAIAVAVRLYTASLRREAAPTIRSYWPGSLLFASRWVAAGRTRQNQSWQRRR
jgi:sodium pump decarboxylase gamma subunit